MRILVIAAHPDDEVLGCGGTIAKHAAEEADVYTIILGEGVTSRFPKREEGLKSKELKELKSYINKAAKILGVKKTFTFGFPDNRFDTVALLDIVKVIEKVKNEVKPEIVYTHHWGDLNIDHRITYDTVLSACRPIKGETVQKIYSFEIPSSTEWNYPNTFSPNVYVDISETINKKIEAMKAYKSEIRKWPHPRSIEAIRVLACKRGYEVGLEKAEGFKLVRSILK